MYAIAFDMEVSYLNRTFYGDAVINGAITVLKITKNL